LVSGDSIIKVTGKMESAPYVEMTQRALSIFGVETESFHINGSFPFRSPGSIDVEGDWSNGAFFLAAGKMGNEIIVTNLDDRSPQGDRAVAEILTHTDSRPVISATDIPDLIPILAVYFAANDGAVFTNIGRLRLKESDRVDSVKNLLHNLGIRATADDTTLTVFGGKFTGGTVNACGDHRIAMAAAIAATACKGEVVLIGCECVNKSYPGFFDDFTKLGGKVNVF